MQQPPGWGPPPGHPQHGYPPHPQQQYPQGHYGPAPGWGPPQPPPRKPNWYHGAAIVLPTLFCCFPVGLGLLWTSPAFKPNSKVALTLATGALALFGAVTAANAPKRQTAGQSVAAVASATAAPQDGSPVLCSTFHGVPGFKSGSWRQFYESEWGCIGGPVTVSGVSPSENSLSYHVMGNRETVGYARLRLVVNDRATSSEAHRSLVSYSEKMFAAALGQDVPAHVSSAILSAKPGEWTIGGKLVIVDIDQWPTGKGYDVRLTISLSSAADPRKR